MSIRQLCVTLMLAIAINAPAFGLSENSWEDISDVGVYGLIGTALLLPTALTSSESNVDTTLSY